MGGSSSPLLLLLAFENGPASTTTTRSLWVGPISICNHPSDVDESADSDDNDAAPPTKGADANIAGVNSDVALRDVVVTGVDDVTDVGDVAT